MTNDPYTILPCFLSARGIIRLLKLILKIKKWFLPIQFNARHLLSWKTTLANGRQILFSANRELLSRLAYPYDFGVRLPIFRVILRPYDYCQIPYDFRHSRYFLIFITLANPFRWGSINYMYNLCWHKIFWKHACDYSEH